MSQEDHISVRTRNQVQHWGLGENAATAVALPRTDAALTRIEAAVAVFCRASAAPRLFLSAHYI